MNRHKPRLLIIYTGGTIGMIEDAKTRVLKPFDFTHLMENVPKVKMLDYVIDNVSFAKPIDSSNMDLAGWQAIAKHIADNYDNYDGFVVLHGTDTMAYTASALSFMLENLAKPVIITGSQLPIGEVRTDGEENLITALQIAASVDHAGQPIVQEVAILFEDYLWRGNRSTKMSADNFNAFKSNNYPPLARIGLGIKFNHEALWRGPADAPLTTHYGFNPHVLVIDLHPALTPAMLDSLLNLDGIKGVILKTYGAGNGPTAEWFTNSLRRAVDRGMVVVNVTQCVNGGIIPKRYTTGMALWNAGVIPGLDMTTEAAIAKLSHLLARDLSAEAIKEAMQRSLCGELTPETVI